MGVVATAAGCRRWRSHMLSAQDPGSLGVIPDSQMLAHVDANSPSWHRLTSVRFRVVLQTPKLLQGAAHYTSSPVPTAAPRHETPDSRPEP
jgi:hypothetical protein